MSLSSKMRKESSESNAAQAMHSPMGLHPEQGLAQLNDKGLENELPSRVADSSDTDVPGDYQSAQILADDSSTDEDNGPLTYEQSTDDMPPSMTDRVADADWNRSTAEGAIPATRANEPDRTLGNS